MSLRTLPGRGRYAEKLYSLVGNDLLLDTLVMLCPGHASGLHGLYHWYQVLKNGLEIAKDSGADVEVVKLFALFHDCMRKYDAANPGHGAEGAHAARLLRARGVIKLDDSRLETLAYACTYHTDGLVSSDATIGTCWDADRLDLLRVGIKPSVSKLSTETARTEAVLCGSRW